MSSDLQIVGVIQFLPLFINFLFFFYFKKSDDLVSFADML